MQLRLFLTFGTLLVITTASWPQQGGGKRSVPPADPCPEATTDMARTNCWEGLAQKADVSLTALYQKIRKAIRDKIATEPEQSRSYREGTLEKLKAAQLAWRRYRDAQCEAEETAI
jgi:uncharacterized protein YecT (DUF1311 family)